MKTRVRESEVFAWLFFSQLARHEEACLQRGYIGSAGGSDGILKVNRVS